MLAQLAQLLAVTGGRTWAAALGTAVAPPATCLVGEGLVGTRHDLDSEWIGEGQRHLVQTRVALNLERQSVDAVAADASAHDPQHHAQASARGHLALRRDDVD